MSTVTSADLDARVKGMTVSTMFGDTVSRAGDRVAVRWKNDDESWGEWTWNDMADKACRAAAGLRRLGIERGDRVVLMVRNRPEFHVVDTAANLLGATAVSIYNSSSPEQIEYLVNDCGAKVGLVENSDWLERFLKVRDDLTSLETLIVCDDNGASGASASTYAALLDNEPLPLDELVGIAQPDDLATLIYTSGTTGPSKGVMITHYNVVWTVASYEATLMVETPRSEWEGMRVVSYLPMAHIAERMISHYLGIALGAEITTCPEPGSVAAYLPHVRPETFFGVPRVWEKIHAGVIAAVAADPEKSQKFNEAVDAGAPLRDKVTAGETLTDDEQGTLDFLDEVAFKGVRELLGFDALRTGVTGAAPIPAELLRWFRTIGVPLSEIYGLSECTGPMTWEPFRVKPGTVGRPMPGVEVVLAEDGEVLGRGGNNFSGYLNLPDKTTEALDEEGWLHTGDIGEFDDEGYLKIVDRKKELIITAGGKNISPANLEAALKTITPIGQACAIGDQRKFMSALVVLDPEVAPGWARSTLGVEAPSLVELAASPEVVAAIDAEVRQAMSNFNNTEAIKKVTVLGEEWLPDSELLTPTSKLKRRGVHARYEAEIEAMYT
ncbi:MAG TPA: long-chain fatty acid--CoA ligase [Acidimicrobiales bacterium]